MNKLLRVVFGLVALGWPAHAQETNPGPYQRRDVSVDSFDRIEISGPFKVSVMGYSKTPKVWLSGPPAMLADTIAKVEDGKLLIRFRDGARWSWNPGAGMQVAIDAPQLSALSVAGPAQVSVHSVEGETFSASISGAGTIDIGGMDVGQAMFATGGSGSIRAEGTARDARYATGGAGSIEAKRLRVETAKIAIGGAGSIYADVSERADISVGGAGRVEVVGGAACVKQPVDSPRIECR